MRKIAFLAYRGFQILDVTGPLAAFEIAGRFQPGAYAALKVVAAAPGAIASTSGALLHAEALPPPRNIDTLIISGGEGGRAAMLDPKTQRFIRAAAKHARRVASVCSGAYLLAQLGLLDGKRCTTHWNRTADFARRYPKAKLEADKIFVKAGKFWTSAGITAGIDLALALIAEDLGEDTARRVAQQLVVYRRRPGGQSQFSALLAMERADGRFSPLLDFMRSNLGAPLRVDELAAHARMSPRNFARAFQAETGVTPAKAVERLRVEAARAILESGAASVQQVALDVGFGDPERMRRAFVRLHGAPPSALKHV